MAQATDMNETTPLPNSGNFRLQMEGMAVAGLYVLAFAWIHMQQVGPEFSVTTTKLLAVFFAGLILVPLVAAMPLVLLRRFTADTLQKQTSLAAFLPFARLALFALQGLAIWIVTREAYLWVFATPAGIPS